MNTFQVLCQGQAGVRNDGLPDGGPEDRLEDRGSDPAQHRLGLHQADPGELHQGSPPHQIPALIRRRGKRQLRVILFIPPEQKQVHTPHQGPKKY